MLITRDQFGERVVRTLTRFSDQGFVRIYLYCHKLKRQRPGRARIRTLDLLPKQALLPLSYLVPGLRQSAFTNKCRDDATRERFFYNFLK